MSPRATDRPSPREWAARVEELFVDAVELPPGERAAYLDRACDDAALRAEVEALLQADTDADGFLDLDADAPAVGQQIGRYRIVRKLGEGGTGAVFLAARADDDFHQLVALKLIRPGMGSPQLVRRFRQERRILAGLGHDNIARLFDAGTTTAGRPYFVMEYVDGEPIDVHCEARRLPLERRLALFATVCRAVHFAHQNMVVHRDLKPSNILVDQSGTPKLVDFGVAKLLDPTLRGRELEPMTGHAHPMTPHYASPEQVRGQPVTAASDVYSLGVVLYQLLSGRRPYELETLSLAELERKVCQLVPPPPSQACDGGRKRRLPRDLDNIVQKAMHKDPAERYHSAQELADDLRRFVEHRPVQARPSTLGYRVGSFVRRNPALTAAALVVFVSLVAGALTTTWQWRRAVAERRRAEAQRERAEETLRFIVQLFDVKALDVDGDRITARELLDRGAERARTKWQGRPDAQAALESALGAVYANLGAYAKAAELLQHAADRLAAAAPDSPELAERLLALGKARLEAGQPYAAESVLQRALGLRTRQLGPDAVAVADVLEQLSEVEAYIDRRDQAERMARRALDICRRALAPSDPRVAQSLVSLAAVLVPSDHFAQAEPLLRQALAIRRRAGDDPDQARVLSLLVLVREHLGYYADAAGLLEQTIAAAARRLGPHHIDVADLEGLRIGLWRELGRYADAEAQARANLAVQRARRGEDHPAFDHALGALAEVLLAEGKLDEARQAAARSLGLRQRRYGAVHGSVGSSLVQLGDIALASGEPASAEARFRRALAILHRTLGDEHPAAVRAMLGLARALAAQGRSDDARRLAERALAIDRRRLRHGHPDVAVALETLATIERPSAPARAEQLLSEALAIRRAALPAGHPLLARTAALLADWTRPRATAAPTARRGDAIAATPR